MRGPMALAAACLALASGCGGAAAHTISGSTATQPTTSPGAPQMPLARQMDAICAQTTTALVRWARAGAHDLQTPPRVLRRESSRLSKLHAPQTSQAGLTRFAEEIRELSVIYKGLKNQSLQAFKQISLKTQKPGNIAMRIAHQLGASACVLQASGRAK